MKLIHVGRTTSWKSVSEEVFKDIQDTKNVGLYDILRKDKTTPLPKWSEADSVRDAIEKDIATFERKIDMARNDREEEMDFQIKCGDYMMSRYLLQEASLKFTRALEIARSVQGSNQRSIETMKKLMVAYVVFESEAQEF